MAQLIKGKYLADLTIEAGKLASSSVIADKIADDAVLSAKIQDSAVVKSKIADDAVDESKILLSDNMRLRAQTYNSEMELLSYNAYKGLQLLEAQDTKFSKQGIYYKYDPITDTIPADHVSIYVDPQSEFYGAQYSAQISNHNESKDIIHRYVPDAANDANLSPAERELLSGYGYIDFVWTSNSSSINTRIRQWQNSSSKVNAIYAGGSQLRFVDMMSELVQSQTEPLFGSGSQITDTFSTFMPLQDNGVEFFRIYLKGSLPASLGASVQFRKALDRLEIRGLREADSSMPTSPVLRSQLLGSDNKLLPEIMPDISITSVQVVSSEANRDALDVQTGDVAIVVYSGDAANPDKEGDKESFIYDGSAWQLLKATDSVVKVNGVEPGTDGNVVIDGGDVAHDDSQASSGTSVSSKIKLNAESIADHETASGLADGYAPQTNSVYLQSATNLRSAQESLEASLFASQYESMMSSSQSQVRFFNDGVNAMAALGSANSLALQDGSGNPIPAPSGFSWYVDENSVIVTLGRLVLVDGEDYVIDSTNKEITFQDNGQADALDGTEKVKVQYSLKLESTGSTSQSDFAGLIRTMGTPTLPA